MILRRSKNLYNAWVPNFEKLSGIEFDSAPCLDGLLLHAVKRATEERGDIYGTLPEDRLLINTCISWDIENTNLISGGSANIYQISCPRKGCVRSLILAEETEGFRILDLGDACLLSE